MLLLYYQFNFHWAVFEGYFRVFFCGKVHISSKHIICFEKVLFTELIVILIWFFLEENAILTAFSSCYPHFHNYSSSFIALFLHLTILFFLYSSRRICSSISAISSSCLRKARQSESTIS